LTNQSYDVVSTLPFDAVNDFSSSWHFKHIKKTKKYYFSRKKIIYVIQFVLIRTNQVLSVQVFHRIRSVE